MPARRAFCEWAREHFAEIKQQAEATTRSGRLRNIEHYTVSRIVYLRFDYTTGDAAGQNMVGKATSAACDWVRKVYPGIRHFQLSGNLDTDKKASMVNMMHTRGKRVVAEATIPNELLRRLMHVDAAQLFRARLTSNTGTFLAGANNNGLHAANALAAIFIATGQDAANVAESSAAITHVELLPNGGYYYSITLPSLIVATYGGGTGLPSQRECLELLGCYGAGKVYKFAEIVAATVLCGELSLGSAVVAEEWVTAHDQYGRNRP
jgi:hydroxymethylglutaryl-CoA reductase (NADPH)